MRQYTSIALFVLLALSGCAREADVYAIVQDRAYSPSEFKHAAANKAFRTVIAGNPFKSAQTRAVHDGVLAAMQTANWWQPLPFTPKTVFTETPKGLHNARYHVVVALNPDEGKNWYSAPCAGQGKPPTLRATEEIKVRMIFCRDTAPLSISHGTLPGPATPDETRYKRMITRLTMELFPQRRDDHNCIGSRRKGSC